MTPEINNNLKGSVKVHEEEEARTLKDLTADDILQDTPRNIVTESNDTDHVHTSGNLGNAHNANEVLSPQGKACVPQETMSRDYLHDPHLELGNLNEHMYIMIVSWCYVRIM